MLISNVPQPQHSCLPKGFRPARRPALVVAHPGHELMMFGWVSEMKPVVHIFTDGTGSGGSNRRLQASRRLVQEAGAVPGAIFSYATDPEFYAAFIEARAAFFVELLDRLVQSFLADETDFVVSDAVEGGNPTHDLCSLITGTAAAIVARRTRRPLPHYTFNLMEWWNPVRHSADENCWHLELDEAGLEEKLHLAREYPGLQAEIGDALNQRGSHYFALECLRKAEPFPQARFEAAKPYYETYAEGRRADGVFSSVIRYRQHVRPIVEAVLQQCAPVHA